MSPDPSDPVPTPNPCCATTCNNERLVPRSGASEYSRRTAHARPDGFLDAPTSVATGVVAAVAVGVALRGARRELDDRTAPLAGLVATFVFATQMLNFPVGAGTSGHLLGGALAAVLVGPVHRRCCA